MEARRTPSASLNLLGDLPVSEKTNRCAGFNSLNNLFLGKILSSTSLLF